MAEISVGIAQRDALSMAENLGCSVGIAKGTGDVVISHPKMVKKIRMNCRRKDTPRVFVVWLRKLIDLSSTAQ